MSKPTATVVDGEAIRELLAQNGGVLRYALGNGEVIEIGPITDVEGCAKVMLHAFSIHNQMLSQVVRSKEAMYEFQLDLARRCLAEGALIAGRSLRTGQVVMARGCCDFLSEQKEWAKPPAPGDTSRTSAALHALNVEALRMVREHFAGLAPDALATPGRVYYGAFGAVHGDYQGKYLLDACDHLLWLLMEKRGFEFTVAITNHVVTQARTPTKTVIGRIRYADFAHINARLAQVKNPDFSQVEMDWVVKRVALPADFPRRQQQHLLALARSQQQQRASSSLALKESPLRAFLSRNGAVITFHAVSQSALFDLFANDALRRLRLTPSMDDATMRTTCVRASQEAACLLGQDQKSGRVVFLMAASDLFGEGADPKLRAAASRLVPATNAGSIVHVALSGCDLEYKAEQSELNAVALAVLRPACLALGFSSVFSTADLKLSELADPAVARTAEVSAMLAQQRALGAGSNGQTNKAAKIRSKL